MMRHLERRFFSPEHALWRLLTGPAPTAVVVLVALLGPGQGNVVADTNRWNTLSSPTFTQALLRMECPFQTPCHESAFAIGADSEVFCPGNVDDPVPMICAAEARGKLGWEMRGFAGAYPSDGPCGTPGGTQAEFHGFRNSPENFGVSGVVSHDMLPASVELAVLRFSGDPTIFDGVEATTVTDLVTMGLIAESDILFLLTFDNWGDEFVEDVDVTGLADEEILLYSIGIGPIPEYDVPATTTTGTVTLTLTMVGLGVWWLMRGRREHPTHRAP
jgi:hypothetical protein